MKKLILLSVIAGLSLFANEDLKENTQKTEIVQNKIEAKIISSKNLIVGTNEVEFQLTKNDLFLDGEAKLKVFMPEMPGMPYMEFEDKQTIKEGKVKFKINLSMPGTWQYQLKIKNEKEIIKGSFNI